MTSDSDSQSVSQFAGAAEAEWIAMARRLAPLVDGVEYFRDVRRALIAARRQVIVVGWDIHSEIDLLRGEEAERAQRDEPWPVRLADLLLHMVEQQDELEIFLLIWEGSPLFVLERQKLPRMKMPWGEHSRIKLQWDRDTPRMGSHHQKIIVVDDRVAFAGGMDLTAARWDDHAHRADDERRRKPGPLPAYGRPYHEVMLAVDDDAALTLGEWCRVRWRRATGETLEHPDRDLDSDDPWPDGLEPMLRDRSIAIALTEPDHAGRTEKRQVEASYLAQIHSACRLIFIESQYLTCENVVEALCERLTGKDPPEILIILPHGSSGSIQQLALDSRRDDLLDRLREADPGGRLGVYWPGLDGDAPRQPKKDSVYVHAKTMVIDDRLIRIGSANLTDRSMGLDTELDLFTAVGEEERDAIESIVRYRRRLLAYLLGVETDRLAEQEEETGSVLQAIEALRGGGRTLRPFDHRTKEFARTVRIPAELADPARPLDDMDADRLLRMIDRETSIRARLRLLMRNGAAGARRWRGLIILGAVVLVLALLWTFTPLSDLVDRDLLDRVVSSVRSSPLGIPGVLVAFVLLAAIGMPVTLLVITTCAAFEMWGGVLIALMGVTGAAALDFLLGRVFQSNVQRLLSAPRIRRVIERVAERGVLAVAVVRNVPVAPFAIVNLACGATPLSWPSYMSGTVIGMTPGILVIGLFGHEIGALVTEPTAGGLAKVVLAAVLVIVAAIGADAALRRWAPDAVGDNDDTGQGS